MSPFKIELKEGGKEMIKILGMAREDIITNLNPYHITRILSSEEIMYIAEALGAFWQYDYYAAYYEKKWGYHAELKSGKHSDAFFDSKLILQYPSIKKLIAYQMAMRIRRLKWGVPDFIAGVSDGATELAREIAGIMGAEFAELTKRDGRIVLLSSLGHASLLLVEDVCSSGTGFTEAVLHIRSKEPGVRFFPVEPVILNRGGLRRINIKGEWASFKIVALAVHPVREWNSKQCLLCERGSKAIKPKETEENWRLITK